MIAGLIALAACSRSRSDKTGPGAEGPGNPPTPTDGAAAVAPDGGSTADAAVAPDGGSAVDAESVAGDASSVLRKGDDDGSAASGDALGASAAGDALAVSDDVAPPIDVPTPTGTSAGLSAVLTAQRAGFIGSERGATVLAALVDGQLGVYVEDHRAAPDRGTVDHRWVTRGELQAALGDDTSPLSVAVIAPLRELVTSYDATTTGVDARVRCDEVSRSCTTQSGSTFRFVARSPSSTITSDLVLAGVLLAPSAARATDRAAWTSALDALIAARTRELGWPTTSPAVPVGDPAFAPGTPSQGAASDTSP